MAMHRERVILPLVPPKLRTFSPYDWSSFEEWSKARFEWLLSHPDRTIDGMDPIDVLYERIQDHADRAV
jgi:hypothetical protein